MTTRNRSLDVLFMSTCLFKQLSCSESYVFAHIAFFLSQRKYNNGVFKQTTQAICNKIGYSPNTVRTAIDSLIEKGFIARKEGKGDDFNENNFTYIQQVAHKFVVGDSDYAKLYVAEFGKMLALSGRSKKSKTTPSTKLSISFFKVATGQLVSALPEKANRKDKNISKHLHRLMILHGYLSHHDYFNRQKGRGAITRTVTFLTNMTNWSGNTIRRLLNTMASLGNISYLYQDKAVTFSQITTNFRFGPISLLTTTLRRKLDSVASGASQQFSQFSHTYGSNSGSITVDENTRKLRERFGNR